MSYALPPRPDPLTGEPRPPRAPVEASHDEGFPEIDPRRRPTKLPPGEGPMLEWYRVTNRYALALGALAAVFVFVGGFLVDGDFDFQWVTSPWGLLVPGLPLAAAGLLYWHFRTQWVAAGAEWVANPTGWVQVYELTEVHTLIEVVKVRLCLTDTAGHKMDAQLDLLQHNRDLWDLVYNGILHSIRERDVTVDRTARMLLQLHGPLLQREVLDRRDEEKPTRAELRPGRGRHFRAGRPRSWLSFARKSS